MQVYHNKVELSLQGDNDIISTFLSMPAVLAAMLYGNKM